MTGVTEVGFRLLSSAARVPVRATPESSGYDLHACLPGGPIEVGPQPVAVPTGIVIEPPAGTDTQIRPRSGLAKQGVLATLGTIDADYRGELMVTLYTVGRADPHEVRHGDRIAQLVFSRLEPVVFVERDSMSGTSRGAGGHGSTGR